MSVWYDEITVGLTKQGDQNKNELLSIDVNMKYAYGYLQYLSNNNLGFSHSLLLRYLMKIFINAEKSL